MPDDGGELWEFTQLIRLEKRFDLTLVVVGLPACRETPRFLGHFALADVFGGNDGGVLIGGGEDEFVAQIEHENVGVVFIERTVNGGIRLRGDHDGGAGLPDDACGAVVGKGGFCAGTPESVTREPECPHGAPVGTMASKSGTDSSE